MCNPRRVVISTGRDIAQAWSRQVTRSASLTSTVAGEARLRQRLADSLGPQVLLALQARLDGGVAGWAQAGEHYRCEVEGGHLLLDVEQGVLEIVALRRQDAKGDASAAAELSGTVSAHIETTVERQYYDDGWGGHTEERARSDAQTAAERELDQASQQRLREAADAAEQAHDTVLREQAQAAAQRQLDERAAALQQQLEAQARQDLEAVGLRARQAFNGLLAQAYRDVLLAYARSQAAEGIQCRDEGGVMEIEFFLKQ